jgi:hypothetical protein
MKFEIKTYLHSSKGDNIEMAESLEKKHGIEFSKKLFEKLVYLNYEVCLIYELDTETDTVTYLRTESI